MPHCFPDKEVAEALKVFGAFSVSPVRSQGIVSNAGQQMVTAGAVEAVVFSMFDQQVPGLKNPVTFQFRVVPYEYPSRFPVFYLVSPRTYQLIPSIYTRANPSGFTPILPTGSMDDPRRFGWPIDARLARVHFCQLEAAWSERSKAGRSLVWGLSQLRALLRNPQCIDLSSRR